MPFYFVFILIYLLYLNPSIYLTTYIYICPCVTLFLSLYHRLSLSISHLFCISSCFSTSLPFSLSLSFSIYLLLPLSLSRARACFISLDQSIYTDLSFYPSLFLSPFISHPLFLSLFLTHTHTHTYTHTHTHTHTITVVWWSFSALVRQFGVQEPMITQCQSHLRYVRTPHPSITLCDSTTKIIFVTS